MPTVVLLVIIPLAGAVYRGVTAGGESEVPPLSRKGSALIDADPEQPLVFARVPAAYSMTYSVERYDKAGIQLSIDHLEIRRPFDARIRSEVNGKPTGERVTRFGVLALTTGDGARSLANPPSPSGSDVRVEPVLADAVADDAAEVREQRRVLGRVCQVYRVGSTIAAGDLVPIRGNPGEHADICIDEAGLLLEEVWVKDGKPLRRRIATRVEEDPAFPDALFILQGETDVGLGQGNGFVRTQDPATTFEGPTYALPVAPEGFAYLGRYAAQPPRLSPFQRELEESPTAEQVSQVDVWVRGADVLLLVNTIAADIAALPTKGRVVTPVDLGRVGPGLAVLDLRTSEVRVELPEARFVRLSGTIDRDDLIALARTLVPVVGTGPVFL